MFKFDPDGAGTGRPGRRGAERSGAVGRPEHQVTEVEFQSASAAEGCMGLMPFEGAGRL